MSSVDFSVRLMGDHYRRDICQIQCSLRNQIEKRRQDSGAKYLWVNIVLPGISAQDGFLDVAVCTTDIYIRAFRNSAGTFYLADYAADKSAAKSVQVRCEVDYNSLLRHSLSAENAQSSHDVVRDNIRVDDLAENLKNLAFKKLDTKLSQKEKVAFGLAAFAISEAIRNRTVRDDFHMLLNRQ